MIVDVGAVADYEEGSVTLVRAGGREIGIVRWRDEVYAVSNVCAHMRGPLCRGTLSGRLYASEPGMMELDESAPVLACPWHGWEFDVRTGRSIWDHRYSVRTYRAKVEASRVFVELPGPERQ